MQVPQVDGITVLDDGAITANIEALDSDTSASDSDSPQDTDSASEEQAQATSSRSSRLNIKGATGKGAAAPAQQLDQQDADLQDFQDVQERREEMKQQMGVTASKLLQNPEANLPSMRSLLTLAADKDSQVSNSNTGLLSYLDLLYGTCEFCTIADVRSVVLHTTVNLQQLNCISCHAKQTQQVKTLYSR